MTLFRRQKNHLVALLWGYLVLHFLFSAVLKPWRNVHSSGFLEKSSVQSSLSSFRKRKTFSRPSDEPLRHGPIGDLNQSTVQDLLCGGCRHALLASGKSRCGAVLHEFHRQHEQRYSLVQAAQRIAQSLPECQRCHPNECSNLDKKYWSYDRVGPRIVEGRTMELDSIPAQHRFPAVLNVKNFVSDQSNIYPAREYLFSFNPSFVILPQDQRPSHHPTATYLATFRVSNQVYCFRPTDREQMFNHQRPPAKNYLGVALIDANLSILTNVVVKLVGFAAAEDYRVFVLHGQLYVTSNDQIAPIWLNLTNENRRDAVELPTVFGNDKNDLTVFVRSFPSCAPCERQRGFCGKNLNYFVSHTNQTVAEIWPSQPHLTRQVDLGSPCERKDEPITHVDEQTTNLPSFATLEELHYPSLGPKQTLLTRGRGSACCIDMEHPSTKQKLLVGVQHSKTPSQGNMKLPFNVTANHYLSSLYAFEPSPPFRVVARSGLFCLGFPTKTEERQHPIVSLTTWRRLYLGQEFDCPRIHFVSGITHQVDDPSMVIVAYGINDCLSRLIRVPMAELSRLLFGPV